MRLFAIFCVILLSTAQLLADPSVESCASDSASSSQQNTTSYYRQQSSTTLNAYVSDNVIHVADVTDGSTLYIYSITGARIGSYTVRDNKVTLNDALPKGIYIIRVNNRATKITVR